MSFIKMLPRYRVDEVNKKVSSIRGRKKKTTEEYKEELKIKNPNVEVIGEYIDAKTKILHRCKNHNIEWNITPSNALRGQGCCQCKSEKIIKRNTISHEEYVKQLLNIDTNVIALEEYINAKTPILHKFLDCGHIHRVSPTSILCGNKCLQCAHLKLKEDRVKTQEQFEQEVFSNNCNLKIIGQYINAQTPIKTKCLICDYIWNPIADSLVKNFPTGCPNCAGRIVSPNDFYERFNNNGNKNIILTSEYINSHTKLNGYCKICGYIINMFPFQLVRGDGCRQCANKENGLKHTKSHDIFVDELYEINPNIKVIGKYSKAREKIECQCLYCLYIWNPTADSLLSGTGCPKCNFSHGEVRISNYLQSNNIIYIAQFKFENLKGLGNKSLSYDFYIPTFNLLIEFQGKQHEQSISYFGGEEQFKKQQEHDRRKREYAKQNNINLLEIWYYDMDNIESILLQKINEIKENNLKLESVTTAIPA